MANIKVSELPTATSFNDSDYVMIVQSNTNKKITKQNMYGNYIYSTNETVIGKWIDDKPIYRKVITGTASQETRLDVDLSSMNVETVINAYGWAKSTYDQWWYISNYFAREPNYWTSLFITADNKLNIDFGIYFSYPQYRIVVEYTKTTD